MRGPIRCPKCNKEIVLLHGVYCPYCGYDYSEWLMLPSRDARVINENIPGMLLLLITMEGSTMETYLREYRMAQA